MRNRVAYVAQVYQNISAPNDIFTPAISMEGLSHNIAILIGHKVLICKW
jgi:hypothetical protein